MKKENVFIIVNTICAVLISILLAYWYKSLGLICTFCASPIEDQLGNFIFAIIISCVILCILAFFSSKKVPRLFWLWPILYLVFIIFFQILSELDLARNDLVQFFCSFNFLITIFSVFMIPIILPSLLVSYIGKIISERKK